MPTEMNSKYTLTVDWTCATCTHESYANVSNDETCFTRAIRIVDQGMSVVLTTN
jgi:hypothetical protein